MTTGTRESHVLTGHRGFVRIVNWSSDSKWIVTGARDNTIRVFDVETGALVCNPLTGHTSVPTMLTLRSSSPHHDEVVSGRRVCLIALASANSPPSWSGRDDQGLGTWYEKICRDSDNSQASQRLGQMPHFSLGGLNLHIYSDPLGRHFTSP